MKFVECEQEINGGYETRYYLEAANMQNKANNKAVNIYLFIEAIKIYNIAIDNFIKKS